MYTLLILYPTTFLANSPSSKSFNLQLSIITETCFFLPILDKLFTNNTEFYQRYVLVTLLYYYLEAEDFSIVQAYIKRANTQKYYVYMAVAWLVAEVLVKHYDNGLTLLQSIQSDTKTYNKAIQKAIESFRISKEQKETLRSLKIK